MIVSLESQKVNFAKPIKKNGSQVNIIKIYIISILVIIVFLLLKFYTGSYKISGDVVTSSGFSLPYHSIDALDYRTTYGSDSEVFINHGLKESDTLSSIAIKYGLSVQTIINVNNISDVNNIKQMSKLLIPPVDGFIYFVKKDDTIKKISKRFSVSMEEIFILNKLKSIYLGNIDALFIPFDFGKTLSAKETQKFFIFPSYGYVSMDFGDLLSQGIDIIPIEDDRVFASKAGKISNIGIHPNYGKYIFIDHSSGYRTLYGHLEKINVRLGQYVEQGDILGDIGKSGATTQKKLFFTIIKNDIILNPHQLLF